MRYKAAFLLCTLFLSACSSSNRAPPNLNMVISVSSDGHYALATNTNKQVILWDLQAHTYRIIFKDANIYSAYFIKNSSDFIYQNDATNEVVVENINGQVIKRFNPGFPTYGQVMTSNLEQYFASDDSFTIYKIDLAQNKKSIIIQFVCPPAQATPGAPKDATFSGCASFEGADQIFALTFSPNEKLLVGAADSGFNVWNVATGKLVTQVGKNDEETVAAINPDGHYLVTGDIMNRSIKYNLQSNAYQGFFYRMPLDQAQQDLYGQGASEILAIKFIDNNKLLVFRHMAPWTANYAFLYDTRVLTPISGHPDWAFHHEIQSIAMLPLIDDPDQNYQAQDNWPLVSDDFSRDQAIDTSPSAHILVMSQQNANGIIVYRYDPATQTLAREWSGVVRNRFF